MSDALSDELFNPLDLDEALDDAYQSGGQEAAVELLAQALADPRAEGDPSLADYLDELAEHYGEMERYDEAITTAHRIIELAPDERIGELTWIAGLHAKNGDLDEARTLLYRLRAEHEAAGDWDRDLWHGLTTATILADEVGDFADAADWLAEDIRTGIRTKVDVDLVRALYSHLRRIAAEATPPMVDRPLDLLVQQYAETHGPAARPGAAARPSNRPRDQVRLPYLPAAEFVEAGHSGLLGGEGAADHTAHRREIEQALCETPPGSLRVVPLTVPALIGFAEDSGLDPAEPATWMRYAEESEEPGVLWPPERNDACWCGSGVKYKKCCRAL